MLNLHRKWKLPMGAVIAALWLGGPLETPAATSFDALLQRLNPQNGVRVYDFSGILKPDQKNALEGILNGLEQQTGAQAAVVVVDSLEGGQIDDFANKLFGKWGIGQKGKNNGILLLVALKDRKARIEVGYGLEPILPDALAGRILNEQLFPAFRNGNPAEGLTLAVRRIAKIVVRNEPPPKAPVSSRSSDTDASGMIVETLFLGVFILIGFFVMGGGVGARSFPSIMWGAIFGGVPLFMAFSGLGSIPRTILGSVAGVMGLFGLIKGVRSPKSFQGWTLVRGSGGRGSGWSGGGGFSSGGFSGGGGGGFGGGSSGGGGASGSW